eukprot:GILJ01005009.1.p1 GENE.GILJ01005009.1~~GILJ01005009.1.p1  ORF type:complete len:618 (-),score=55.71 GILJ01005009.1:38-1891(-)
MKLLSGDVQSDTSTTGVFLLSLANFSDADRSRSWAWSLLSLIDSRVTASEGVHQFLGHIVAEIKSLADDGVVVYDGFHKEFCRIRCHLAIVLCDNLAQQQIMGTMEGGAAISIDFHCEEKKPTIWDMNQPEQIRDVNRFKELLRDLSELDGNKREQKQFIKEHGIKSRSPLWDLRTFDLNVMCYDIMHCMLEGWLREDIEFVLSNTAKYDGLRPLSTWQRKLVAARMSRFTFRAKTTHPGDIGGELGAKSSHDILQISRSLLICLQSVTNKKYVCDCVRRRGRHGVSNAALYEPPEHMQYEHFLAIRSSVELFRYCYRSERDLLQWKPKVSRLVQDNWKRMLKLRGKRAITLKRHLNKHLPTFGLFQPAFKSVNAMKPEAINVVFKQLSRNIFRGRDRELQLAIGFDRLRALEMVTDWKDGIFFPKLGSKDKNQSISDQLRVVIEVEFEASYSLDRFHVQLLKNVQLDIGELSVNSFCNVTYEDERTSTLKLAPCKVLSLAFIRDLTSGRVVEGKVPSRLMALVWWHEHKAVDSDLGLDYIVPSYFSSDNESTVQRVDAPDHARKSSDWVAVDAVKSIFHVHRPFKKIKAGVAPPAADALERAVEMDASAPLVVIDW